MTTAHLSYDFPRPWRSLAPGCMGRPGEADFHPSHKKGGGYVRICTSISASPVRASRACPRSHSPLAGTACRVLLVDTSSYHYKSRRRGQVDLEKRIKEIAETRIRRRSVLTRAASLYPAISICGHTPRMSFSTSRGPESRPITPSSKPSTASSEANA